MGNDVIIWEMAQVLEKRLNYVGNDLNVWEMASNMWGNDLFISQTA